MRKVYCISGLGADKRIFTKINLPGYELVHIDWPLHSRGDTLVDYAKKVSDRIDEDHPDILGVSFGGMLATEINKIRAVRRTIIVSSAKSRKELFNYGRFIRSISNAEILPPALYKMPTPMMYYMLGTETVEERELLKRIMLDSDKHFVKWATKAILNWINSDWSNSIVHIHGRKDKVIPARNIVADYWIDDGGHFMVYNRAEQINQIIEKELNRQ